MTDMASMSMEQLAVFIANQLRTQGIEVVLVGGLAVTCYTSNRYLTKDIDMVDISYQKPAVLTNAMGELGFYKQGRVFVSDNTDIVVEFPAAPLSVGDEIITEFTEFESPYGKIPILKAIDVVKDRLAAYFHWRDRQSLVQALCVMQCHNIKPKQLKLFCENEGRAEFLSELQKLYSNLLSLGMDEMEPIEEFIAQHFLAGLR